MPSYYNPYMSAYPVNYSGNVYQPVQPVMQMPQQPQYMINVDGENSAKSWQPSMVPQPNTIIPLFDSDGQHVYFKTYDAYGRMNPLRKGRIVFDDEVQVSGTVRPEQTPQYATSGDMKRLEQEIESLKQMIQKPYTQQNQNGMNNRGEKR